MASAKTSMVSVLFTPKDRKLIDRLAEKKGVGVSTWIRTAVLAVLEAEKAKD